LDSGQPFDTIKVRMQSMPTPAPGQAPLYAGVGDCLKKTIRNEGASALYKVCRQLDAATA